MATLHLLPGGSAGPVASRGRGGRRRAAVRLVPADARAVRPEARAGGREAVHRGVPGAGGPGAGPAAGPAAAGTVPASPVVRRPVPPARGPGAAGRHGRDGGAVPGGAVSGGVPVGPAPLRLTRRGRLVVRLLLGILIVAALAVAVLGSRRQAWAGTGSPHVTVRHHLVLEGETLWQLATEAAPRDDVRDTVERIVRLNHLPGVGLSAGQSLAIPVRD